MVPDKKGHDALHALHSAGPKYFTSIERTSYTIFFFYFPENVFPVQMGETDRRSHRYNAQWGFCGRADRKSVLPLEVSTLSLSSEWVPSFEQHRVACRDAYLSPMACLVAPPHHHNKSASHEPCLQSLFSVTQRMQVNLIRKKEVLWTRKRLLYNVWCVLEWW